MKRATLRDIAQSLHITVATVSRALKGYPDISAATKEAVLATAKALRYEPHPMAVKLRQQAYKVVGVVVPDIIHPFFSDVISGIVEVVEAEGYHVLLTQSNESFEKETRVTRMLRETGIDGLLICLANDTTTVEHLTTLQEYDLPVVQFDKVSADLPASSVVTDDFQGAFDATEHLIRQGRTRIAHISGVEGPANTRQRRLGYEAALAAHSLPLLPEYQATSKHVVHTDGVAAATTFMALPQPPDAIFAVTDAVAIGALTALKQLGRRVPEDVALIGFSNWAVCELVEPPVSSMAQPGFEIGRRAADLLVREIKARRAGTPVEVEHVVLPATLRARASSASPSGER